MAQQQDKRSLRKSTDPKRRTRIDPQAERDARDDEQTYDPVGMAGKKAGIVKEVEEDLKATADEAEGGEAAATKPDDPARKPRKR